MTDEDMPTVEEVWLDLFEASHLEGGQRKLLMELVASNIKESHRKFVATGRLDVLYSMNVSILRAEAILKNLGGPVLVIDNTQAPAQEDEWVDWPEWVDTSVDQAG